MTSDVGYMTSSLLPALVERLLTCVVPHRHPRPYETISQLPAQFPSGTGMPDRVTATLDPTISSQLTSLDFDVFSIDVMASGVRDVATPLLRHIFSSYQLLDLFRIPEAVFDNFVRLVRDNYHAENPFHNFRHAVNVVQTLHLFLSHPRFSLKSCFQPLEIFAMLIAGLCHDVQHPGFTNKFLCSSLHPLALRYNDTAVLENHHAATTIAMLDHPVGDGAGGTRSVAQSFKSSGASSYQQVRSMLMRCILATDVASHKRHVADVTTLTQRTSGPTSVLSDEDRLTLMAVLVDGADVSNEIRSFAFSRQWAPLVTEEFCREGELERVQYGSQHPVRFNRATISMAEEQMSFIKGVCLPLYEGLAKAPFFVGQQTATRKVTVAEGFQDCVGQLRSNYATWEGMHTASGSTT